MTTTPAVDQSADGRQTPVPRERDWMLVGLLLAQLTLLLAIVALGAMGFFHLDARIDSFETAINARIDGFETSINTVNARIDSLETSINARIDGFETAINARIDGLYELIVSLKQ